MEDCFHFTLFGFLRWLRQLSFTECSQPQPLKFQKHRGQQQHKLIIELNTSPTLHPIKGHLQNKQPGSLRMYQMSCVSQRSEYVLIYRMDRNKLDKTKFKQLFFLLSINNIVTPVPYFQYRGQMAHPHSLSLIIVFF